MDGSRGIEFVENGLDDWTCKMETGRGPLQSTFAKSMEEIPPWLKKQSLFYVLHVTYFAVLGLSGAFVLWAYQKWNSEETMDMTFVDALYCATSALTVTGLLSVRMQRLDMFQQSLLLLLTVVGSHVFTSLLPLYARRLAYRKILKHHARDILCKAKARAIPDAESDLSNISESPNEKGSTVAQGGMPLDRINDGHSHVYEYVVDAAVKEDDHQHIRQSNESARVENPVSWHKFGHFDLKKLQVVKHRILQVIWSRVWKRGVRLVDYMNEVFVSSTAGKTGDDMLQGTEICLWKSQLLEYKALTYLNRIVLAHFLIVQIAGIVVIEVYLCISSDAARILEGNDINRTFFSVYNSVSSFGNAGFTLLDNSMIPFRKHDLLLLAVAIVILLGNTMFAPCLWMIIWVLHRFARGSKRQIYRYLLEHPRKCYTHLFPKNQTLWLMVTVIGFNTAQALFFCILDWNSRSLDGLAPAHKIVDALFQSAATRNAGSNVVNLADLSPPMLVLFVGMMYISVYPVYLTRQKTRAFKPVAAAEVSEADYYDYDSKISVQSRKLLARDSAYLFIIVFLICIIESNNILQDPLNYSVFNVIFEVISAFGNVGLSVGYSCALSKSVSECEDVPYSLSGKWSTGGKILIVVAMFLGRHRGLPDSIDSALLLPRRDGENREILQLAFDSGRFMARRRSFEAAGSRHLDRRFSIDSLQSQLDSRRSSFTGTTTVQGPQISDCHQLTRQPVPEASNTSHMATPKADSGFQF